MREMTKHPKGSSMGIYFYINNIFKLRKEIAIKEYGKEFYSHFEGLFKTKKCDGYYQFAEHIFEVTNSKGKMVLDAGSGFGIISMILAGLGAKKVIGIESKVDYVRVSKNIIKKINSSSKNIKMIRGDILKIPCSDRYFDEVIANEIISHVRDLKSFLDECKRVLKGGGILYICDSNNSLDILGRLKRRKIWRITEFGDKNGRIDKKIIKGYKEPHITTRKRIIKRILKRSNEKELEYLSRQTQGLWGKYFEKVIRDYNKNKKIDITPSKDCRHPISGELQEAEFNPYKLKRLLNTYGFESYIIRPKFHTQSRIKIIAAKFIEALFPLSQIISPKFEIIAKKI